MIKPLFKKIALILLIVLSLVFIVIQFFPSNIPHANPPVTGEPTWNSPETHAAFFKACADCHSNETRWPWYGNVAPVSWLVENDVRSGRKHFNISEWDKRQHNGGKAAGEVQRGAMPIGLYLLMHPDANLNVEEKKKFVKGLTATFGGEDRKREEIKFELEK